MLSVTLAGEDFQTAAGELCGTMSDSLMNQPLQPQTTQVQIEKTPDYRDNYANSVQVRMSLWDFFLVFGTLNQTRPDRVTIEIGRAHV